jgi:acetyl esterase
MDVRYGRMVRMSLLLFLFLGVCGGLMSIAGAEEKASHEWAEWLTPETLNPDARILFKKIGDIELFLHVFYPEPHSVQEARPAIVFFFGGGWKQGHPKQFYPHSRYLALRGMVAICAEYRVEKTHGTTPFECVYDAKSAIRYIRSHAQALGVDPERIAAGGGSAGGHLAAAAGTLSKLNDERDDLAVSCKPGAMVLFNPVFDNSAEGYGYDRVKERWRDFSPLHNIDQDTPPTIVFLGTQDKLIPTTTAEAYKERMEQHNRQCEIHLYEGQPHGFFNYNDGENSYFYQTVDVMDLFLTRLGYLHAKP